MGVLLFASTPAFSSHWVQVGPQHFVDVDTIKRKENFEGYTLSGRYYEAWTKIVAEKKPIKTILNKDVWVSASKILLDCQTRYVRRLSYFAYDANGHSIVEHKIVNEQWQHIHPGTLPFETMDFVCSGDYELHNFDHLDHLLRH